MPFPKTRNVGKLLTFLNAEKPEMGRAQKLAIALDVARRAGKKMKKWKKKK